MKKHLSPFLNIFPYLAPPHQPIEAKPPIVEEEEDGVSTGALTAWPLSLPLSSG